MKIFIPTGLNRVFVRKMSLILESNFQLVLKQNIIALGSMDSSTIDKKICKAVALVSKNEYYQKKLFTFLCLAWVQLALCSLINSMVFTNPLFFCDGIKSTQAYSCQNFNKCTYENNFTGTYYAGLYCEHRDSRMTLQTIYALGCIIGVFIMPIVSDLKGKKMAVRVCLLLVLGGNLMILFGILMKNYVMIGIGQFMCSFGSISIAVISYSLNSDFFSDDLRQKAIIYYCAAWGLTDMFILVVYYVQPYWMFYLLVLIIIPTSALIIYFQSFFLQSPNYLLLHKKSPLESSTLLQKLSTLNNASSSDLCQSLSLLSQIEQIQQMRESFHEEKSATETLAVILRNWKYFKAVICLILVKMAYYCFYFGVQGSLERIGFNFGVSVFLLGFGEFTGYLTGTKFIPKMHRKTVLLSTNILTSILGLLYLTSPVQKSSFLASILLYICFTLSSYNFSAISLLETESFTSTIRSTAVGLVFGVAYLIRLVVPFTVGYLNQRGVHPIIASSVFILGLGVLPVFVVDETYGFSNLDQNLLPKEHDEVKDNSAQIFQLEQKK